MPMVWDAEADAKLLSTLFVECGLKLTQENYQTLAKVMGCTPKAISHRISKYKNAGKPDTTNAKVAKPKPRASAKKGKKAARTPSPDGDNEEKANGELTTPPPSNRPRRSGSKRDYAELAGENDDEEEGDADVDGLDKEVKIKVGEDIGEGLRTENHFEDALGAEGMDEADVWA